MRTVLVAWHDARYYSAIRAAGRLTMWSYRLHPHRRDGHLDRLAAKAHDSARWHGMKADHHRRTG